MEAKRKPFTGTSYLTVLFKILFTRLLSFCCDGLCQHRIKQVHGHEVIAMVGDGVTDLQARPPADLFVGFGGVVTRDVIKENADWFVKDFNDLTRALLRK